MLRLRSYLNPYMTIFIASVVLLFAQANFDLALPDYLSQIVNVGIQQGGVESTVPEAMRTSSYDHLRLFLSEADQQRLSESYRLAQPGDSLWAEQAVDYPLLEEGESLYVLNDLSDSEREALSTPLAKAWLSVAGVEQFMGNPEAAQEMGGAAMGGFDPSTLPPGTDLFQLLARTPAAQREAMAAAMDARVEVMGESMVRQAAIARVRAEYDILEAGSHGRQNRYIIRVGSIMLLMTLLSALAAVSVSYLSSRIAAGIGRDLRHDLFRKVESFSGVEFDKFPTASLITRSTNDVTQLQTVTMMMVRLAFYAPIMGIGGTIRAINKGPSMWWTIAVAVIVLIGLVILIVSIAMPKFRIMQQLIDRLNAVAREQLSGLLVIRAFNKQGFEEERFDTANRDLADNTLFIARVTAVMMPLMMLILNVLSVVILWVGANQVAQANMQVGDMMAFLQYAMQIVFAFLMVSMLFIILPRASVSAERIADVLETDLIIKDPVNPLPLNGAFKGTVEFRDVTFRYPDAEGDVLHDISFVAKPGETTAFIGSTGSGKSTVVNLIPRFYDVSSGQILIDGVDVRDVTQHDLREKIGYVPQRAVLFSGTIASNLRFGDQQATEEALAEAIDIAQAAEFVYDKEGGLAAEIAQGGSNVSGGQRQRLSIARALVKDAPIYIFDDTFSALDYRTDAALRRALRERLGPRTLLVVTQRISTIREADQIIVLDQGRAVGRGTHDELMASCETYQEIARSQLTREELAA